MMVDTSFASSHDSFLLCLRLVSCPLFLGESMYYIYASVVILPYIVVENYDRVLIFVFQFGLRSLDKFNGNPLWTAVNH